MDEQPQLPLGPKSVATQSLRPNPHNPRMLFDELPLRTLEASIKKVGVLVPLTVFKAAGSERYTILDGQRRWICAGRLNLEQIPINEVREPSTAQNIVTMFQIHKLRKDWDLMPTALKLGVLMEELDEHQDRALAELTGLDAAVVSRCKKLLSYEDKYQDMMLFPDPDDRIKADFFIELYPVLHDRLVTKAPWYDRETIIQSFLNKYKNGLSGFKSLTDFRKIKQFLSIAKAAGKEEEVLQRLNELICNDTTEIADLEIYAAKVRREAQNLVKALEKIEKGLDTLNPDEFLGEEDLWLKLELLISIINEKLRGADRRVVGKHNG
jgi:ParB family chromosome partitioning protein